MVLGQSTEPPTGKPFSRPVKDTHADLYAVMNGQFTGNNEAILHVEDNTVQKIVRVDGQLNPAAELVLKDLPFDAALWNGVASFVADGTLYCLLASNTKKATDLAIAQVESDGAPRLGVIKRAASSGILFKSDPTNTLPYRPQPDPILLSKGLQYAQQERIIAAPDGQHYLLNNHTFDEKGNKRFWFAYLDKEFTQLWTGTATLPYADATSRIHQISLANDGTIHLLAYVFACPSEEQQSDKLCHELRLTTIRDQGKTVTDLLVDKDFVSSARLCERDGGKLSMAIRYGALTGQPGWVITFDPAEKKLKPTPLVNQRIPSIRKAKLMGYGSIEAGAKKGTASRTAKIPNEVVALHPAWDGLVVVETFLETALEVPVGEAIAIRRLGGDVRTSYVGANDSIQWQHTAERAFMTTAGQSYDGVGVHLGANGLTLLYDHTPKGLEAILRSGSAPVSEGEEKKGKKDKPAAPAEAGVLKVITLDPRGGVVAQGSALRHPDGLMPCPFGSVADPSGKHFLVKSFDRNNSYTFSLIDSSTVGQ